MALTVFPLGPHRQFIIVVDTRYGVQRPDRQGLLSLRSCLEPVVGRGRGGAPWGTVDVSPLSEHSLASRHVARASTYLKIASGAEYRLDPGGLTGG